MSSEISVKNFFVPDISIEEIEPRNKRFSAIEDDVRERMLALIMADPKDNVVIQAGDPEPKFASDATRKHLRELDNELRKVISDRYMVCKLASYLEDKDIWIKDYGDFREENGGVVLPMFYSCERWDPANAKFEADHQNGILKKMFSELLKVAVRKQKPDSNEITEFIKEYVSELYTLNFMLRVAEAYDKDPKSVEWS